MIIEVPENLQNVNEATLLDLATRCAHVQSRALTELQARPKRNREYDERLAALPTWRRSLVKTLSSKWITVLVAVVVGLLSIAASALEFANNSTEVRREAQRHLDEVERARQQRRESE